MFLRQVFAWEEKLRGANMLGFRTSNFRGTTIRPIVRRHKHSIVFTTKFLPYASSIVNWSILNFLRWKPLKPNVKFAKQTHKNSLNTIRIVYFLATRLYRTIFTDEICPSGVFSTVRQYGLIVSLRGIGKHLVHGRTQFKVMDSLEWSGSMSSHFFFVKSYQQNVLKKLIN